MSHREFPGGPYIEWINSIQMSTNSDIYYCGQEFLRLNGVALIVNKTVQNAVLGYNLKTTE